MTTGRLQKLESEIEPFRKTGEISPNYHATNILYELFGMTGRSKQSSGFPGERKIASQH